VEFVYNNKSLENGKMVETSWFKEIMNTFEEFHYFISGVSIGMIVGIFTGIGIAYFVMKLFAGG
jgi:hypothetical protein